MSKPMQRLYNAVIKDSVLLTLIKKIRMATKFPSVTHNVEVVLDMLEEPEIKEIDGVAQLLQIYRNAKQAKDAFEAIGEIRRHPLIILEGLDGSGKSTVARKFAEKIDGRTWQTPPKSIQHLRYLTDKNPLLYAAYYALGNYIASMEIQLAIQDTPVVMDRYWHSTAAFGIAQAVKNNPLKFTMPEPGDRIYNWPKDLLKPDIVIFLDVDEEIRLQRLSRRKEFTIQENLLSSCAEFRNNVITAYKNMVNPEIIFINGNLSIEAECVKLQSLLKPLLSDMPNNTQCTA